MNDLDSFRRRDPKKRRPFGRMKDQDPADAPLAAPFDRQADVVVRPTGDHGGPYDRAAHVASRRISSIWSQQVGQMWDSRSRRKSNRTDPFLTAFSVEIPQNVFGAPANI